MSAFSIQTLHVGPKALSESSRICFGHLPTLTLIMAPRTDRDKHYGLHDASTQPENSPGCMRATHRVGLAFEIPNKGHYLKKGKTKNGVTYTDIPICILPHSTKYLVDSSGPQIRNSKFRLEMFSPWVLV